MADNFSRRKLSDIADILTGVSYNPDDILKSYKNGCIRVFRGGNVQTNQIVCKSDDVLLPSSYADNNTFLQVGDTVITASTGSVDALGKTAYVISEMSGCYVGAFMRIIRPKNPIFQPLVNMYLQSKYFETYIRAQAKGTSINNITKSYLENFPVYLPNDNNLVGISSLYQNLCKKIALNREINRNLPLSA